MGFLAAESEGSPESWRRAPPTGRRSRSRRRAGKPARSKGARRRRIPRPPRGAPTRPSAKSKNPQAKVDLAIEDPDTRARMRRAVDLGLRYISRRQTEPDGSITMAGNDPAVDHRAPFAVTAIAALAYMADGNSETRGPHCSQLKRAIDYIVGKANFDPDGIGAYLGADGDMLSRMHGHGYATLALAEVLGMGARLRARSRREDPARAHGGGPQDRDDSRGFGGWYYKPTKDLEHEGSVTITLVQALRAARNVGIAVDAEVIKRAVEYVRQSQVKELALADSGAFRYRLQSHETSLALTAAAIATLNATGDYDSENIDRGIRYMLKELKSPTRENLNWRLYKFPAYEQLYLAQAFLQYRDFDLFAQWYRREVPRILNRQKVRVLENQQEEGFWDDDPFGSVFTTAIEMHRAADGGFLPSDPPALSARRGEAPSARTRRPRRFGRHPECVRV